MEGELFHLGNSADEGLFYCFGSLLIFLPRVLKSHIGRYVTNSHVFSSQI